MNRFDTKVSKGDNNTIDFVIRDRDRKPIPLVDKTLNATIYNFETGERLLERQLVVLDDFKGRARLMLYSGDLLDWPPGFYKYTVQFVDEGGTQGFLYTDQVFKVDGNFELLKGVGSILLPTKVVTNFTEQGAFGMEGTSNDFISGTVSGGALDNVSGMLSTVAVYTTGYLGIIQVQATLDNVPSPSDNGSWSTVATFTYNITPITDVAYVNFSFNLTHVRFVHTAEPLNTGTVDQILFRP